MLFLGLDLGTTGVKALLVRDDGTVAQSATSEYPTLTPHPLWSEQEPESWWAATQLVIRSVLRAEGCSPDRIAGIGLTGQMHGLVALDSAGKTVRPAILWNDQRTGSECREMAGILGLNELLMTTGNQVLPGFTAPKLLWLRKHEHAAYNRIAHILLPKDYVRYRLTGEYSTDVSDASGTSLFNVGTRSWAGNILSALGIPREWLPDAAESSAITGHVSAASAGTCGLLSGIPVVAGAGDQAAGGIGNGIVKSGICAVTIGTSGVVFAHSERLLVHKEGLLHAFCHAVSGAWHLMGVTLAAGGSLRWLRDTIGEPERREAAATGIDPYEIFSNEAGSAAPGSEGLFYLPYLSGERTPHPDPSARGAFIGLTQRHTRAHIVRSVMEGVAYSLNDCLGMMIEAGITPGTIRLSGGGARSRVWRQIIADVFGMDVETLAVTDGAPYGAAILAMVGTGRFADCPEACDQIVRRNTTTMVNQRSHDLYSACYPLYRSLYPVLAPVYSQITGMGL
jgi:xylulokinase